MLYKIVASLIDPGAKIAAEASKDVHAVMRLAVDASDAGMLYEFAKAAGAEDADRLGGNAQEHRQLVKNAMARMEQDLPATAYAALNGLIGTILGGVL
jgi:hypothetical protein